MLRKLQMLSFLTVCSLFIVTTISQSTNTCYVNCKQNACTDPIICTDCDTGLLLFGTTCVSSGTMAVTL